MGERTGHRRILPGLAGALVVAMLTAAGLGLGGGRARAQPDRGLQPTIPGDTVTPLPNQMPGERPDRWLLPPDPFRRPVLEVEGRLAGIDGTELLLAGEALPGTGPATGVGQAGTSIDLAGDTTYYVQGAPTTFDRIPVGVPARVTYEYRGERRVALRVEVLEGELQPALAGPLL